MPNHYFDGFIVIEKLFDEFDFKYKSKVVFINLRDKFLFDIRVSLKHYSQAVIIPVLQSTSIV